MGHCERKPLIHAHRREWVEGSLVCGNAVGHRVIDSAGIVSRGTGCPPPPGQTCIFICTPSEIVGICVWSSIVFLNTPPSGESRGPPRAPGTIAEGSDIRAVAGRLFVESSLDRVIHRWCVRTHPAWLCSRWLIATFIARGYGVPSTRSTSRPWHTLRLVRRDARCVVV